MSSKLDAEINAILLECDGTDDYDALMEKWSPEARAASAAARRAKGKGHDWRKAARNAYAGSAAGRNAAVASVAKNVKRSDDAYDQGRKSPYLVAQMGHNMVGRKFSQRADTKALRFGSNTTGGLGRASGVGHAKSKGAKRVLGRIKRFGYEPR